MARSNHIVFTTIFIPSLLWELKKNVERHGHLETTQVWVVGDRKTPPEAEALCREVDGQGLATTYLNIAAQDDWGRRFPQFYDRIPYNNETRRNIGYLHALEAGCERMICIDDDNWPTEADFIGGHLNCGLKPTEALLQEEVGYHNICEHLDFSPARLIYPRGYPFRLRGTLNRPQFVPNTPGTIIGVNAGLWLREPDVDATTWLNGKIESTGLRGAGKIILSQGTWSPINTQNTSVVRGLIPAFFCIPMGWKVPGGMIQRYGDIWGGYFLQSLMQGTDWVVQFGHPLVDHRRNPHDYVEDLRAEYWGMILTDWLLQTLRDGFSPKSNDMTERVLELSDFLGGAAVSALPAWCSEEMRAFLLYTSQSIKLWAVTCRKILS